MPQATRQPAPPNRRPGFSLVELLVVAAIVAVFMAILLVTLGKTIKTIRSWKGSAVPVETGMIQKMA